MHTSQPVRLDLNLHIIRDFVSRVQTAILTRLVADLQKVINLLLIHADASSDLRQALVCVVTRLVDDANVEEVFLLVEQRGAEIVELCGVDFLYGVAGFVDECGGWVPWLDLLAEDGYDAVAIFLEEGLAQVGGVYGFEDLLAEWANVIQIYMRCQQLRFLKKGTNVQISMVWTALGVIALDASF